MYLLRKELNFILNDYNTDTVSINWLDYLYRKIIINDSNIVKKFQENIYNIVIQYCTEIGHYLLIISFLITFVTLIMKMPKKNEIYIKPMSKFNKDTQSEYIVFKTLPSYAFILISFSFFSLIYSFLVTDLSYISLINYSHSEVPIIYKISATWGNHEGSLLLWTWILSFYSFLLSLENNKIKSTEISIYTQKVHALIVSFFILFLILTSNPFLKINMFFSNGAELNPVLQDPLLAIHPPLIYFGYLGLSIPFSIALVAIIHKIEEKYFIFIIRKWNLISWSILTLGIILGSWWAYFELGWGGWWFWDPVENGSLMPWLISLALLHISIRANKISQYFKITIFLSLASFIFSLIGTFVVRSGFLESVHSFASDSNRGLFLFLFIIILIVFILVSIYKYKNLSFLEFITSIHQLIKRSHYKSMTILKNQLSALENTIDNLYNKKKYNPEYILMYSKNGLLYLEFVFSMFVLLIIVTGTFYPYIHKIIFNEGVSLGMSFFNNILIPIELPFIFLLLLAIYSGNLFQLNKRILEYSIYISAIVFSIIIYDFSWEIVVVICCYITIIIYGINMLYSLIKKNQVNTSMYISHIGCLIFISSVAVYSKYREELILLFNVGNKLLFNNLDLIYRDWNQSQASNYKSSFGSFIINTENSNQFFSFPEKRYYYLQDFYSSKPFVLSSLGEDIYMILGDGNYVEGWNIQMYVNPMMSYIWLGSLLIFLGGLLSLKSLIFYKNMKNTNYFN